MTNDVEALAKRHKLEPHPEGGYFLETLRGPLLPNKSPLRRSYTSIIYLLPKGAFSSLHRLDAAEVWIWQGGGTLRVSEVEDTTGKVTHTLLGPREEEGEVLQYEVKAGQWFGAEVERGEYVMSACVVVPGFLWDNFEMAKTEELEKRGWGEEATEVLRRLTREKENGK